MELNVVAEINRIEEPDFDEPLSVPMPSPTQSSVPIEFPCQNSVPNENIDFPVFTEGNLEHLIIAPPPSFQNTPLLPPHPLARSPTRRAAPRRKRRQSGPSRVASLTAPTQQQQRLQPMVNQLRTRFEAIDNRRLELEKVRQRNNDQIDMERLQLDSLRLNIEETKIQSINRLNRVLDDLREILPQLRPLSRP